MNIPSRRWVSLAGTIALSAMAISGAPPVAHGETTASGACGGVVDRRELRASITAPTTAIVGRSVSVSIIASGGGIFGLTVDADVLVSDGAAQSTGRLSGNYTASTSFDFIPNQAGAITISAVVTDKGSTWGFCAIAPLTISTVIQVSAAPAVPPADGSAQAPKVTAVQTVNGRAGKIARFKYRVASGGSATQEALGIYRRGSSKAVAKMTTTWGRNAGVRGVRWRIPASLRPGAYIWCVVSKDSGGNISEDNGGCAKLIVTA